MAPGRSVTLDLLVHRPYHAAPNPSGADLPPIRLYPPPKRQHLRRDKVGLDMSLRIALSIFDAAKAAHIGDGVSPLGNHLGGANTSY